MNELIEPTDVQIEAAFAALVDPEHGWPLPYGARVESFTDSEIAQGKLREADEEADRLNREAIRRVLRAALNATEM